MLPRIAFHIVAGLLGTVRTNHDTSITRHAAIRCRLVPRGYLSLHIRSSVTPSRRCPAGAPTDGIIHCRTTSGRLTAGFVLACKAVVRARLVGRSGLGRARVAATASRSSPRRSGARETAAAGARVVRSATGVAQPSFSAAGTLRDAECHWRRATQL